MGFGMNNTADGWGTGMSNTPPTVAADPGELQPAPGIGNQSLSSEPLGFPIGMPQSGSTELDPDMNSIVYNHLGFQDGFPQ